MILIAMAVIFGLMLFLKSPVLQSIARPEQSTTIALGFILIFAFLFGKKQLR